MRLIVTLGCLQTVERGVLDTLRLRQHEGYLLTEVRLARPDRGIDKQELICPFCKHPIRLKVNSTEALGQKVVKDGLPLSLILILVGIPVLVSALSSGNGSFTILSSLLIGAGVLFTGGPIAIAKYRPQTWDYLELAVSIAKDVERAKELQFGHLTKQHRIMKIEAEKEPPASNGQE